VSSGREKRVTAGVLAPPPVFPVLVVVIAEIARAVRPIRAPWDAYAWSWLIALGLLGAAIALLVGSFVVFRRARTPVEPWKQTRAIVAAGPYAFSRNPIYLAFLLIQLAYAVARPNVWGVLLLPLSVAALHWAVIVREERYLDRLFGEEYRAYRARVRRWV
jgi:protein-S-isoprenylcysteine O-methyltransferase Ste14